MSGPDPDPFAVQRGDEPARTIRALVDALRQNLAGAGADLSTIEYLLREDRYEELLPALARLRGHLEAIDSKTTLAFEADVEARRSETS